MECKSLASDIAVAFQAMFDIGGWNSVLFVLIGFVLGGGLLLPIEYLCRFFEKSKA